MSLRDRLARYWRGFQPELLEALEVEVGPLGERYEQLIQGFEFVRVERLLWSGPVAGRPAKDRVALAQAFLAKAVFKLATTRDLIERLESDDKLRRQCGCPSSCAVPSEATFSRAFAEFAETSRRLRGDFAAGPAARSAGNRDLGRSPGRAYLARCDCDRCSGEAGAQGAKSCEAEARAGAAAQGRTPAEGAGPPGAPTVDGASRDAGGSAEVLQCR